MTVTGFFARRRFGTSRRVATVCIPVLSFALSPFARRGGTTKLEWASTLLLAELELGWARRGGMAKPPLSPMPLPLGLPPRSALPRLGGTVNIELSVSELDVGALLRTRVGTVKFEAPLPR